MNLNLNWASAGDFCVAVASLVPALALGLCALRRVVAVTKTEDPVSPACFSFDMRRRGRGVARAQSRIRPWPISAVITPRSGSQWQPVAVHLIKQVRRVMKPSSSSAHL